VTLGCIINMARCDWATSEILIDYHDNEWGKFTLDDLIHFEHLCLSGFQAGLSWEIVLKKRDDLRKIFSSFNPEVIVRYSNKKINHIQNNKKGIRNKQKIESVVNNAKVFSAIKSHYGSFSKYAFNFLGNEVITNHYKSWKETPSFNEASQELSRLMKKHGFTFFGPTIAYAYLQSVGFINDHITTCFKKL